MPITKRGRPRGTTGKAAVLTAGQVRSVLRVARARGRHADRTSVAFAMSVGLGLRAKELASLRWSDAFEESGAVRDVLHLKAAYTKGARTRDVYLSSPRVRRLLGEYHARCRPWDLGAPLFGSQKGGHMTPASMARFLKALYREAGLPGASSHSGRRTLITRLAERGVDLKAISVIAGHASVRTTAMYVEDNPARLSRILQDVSW
jgi:integrase/recombinase XerD